MAKIVLRRYPQLCICKHNRIKQSDVKILTTWEARPVCITLRPQRLLRTSSTSHAISGAGPLFSLDVFRGDAARGRNWMGWWVSWDRGSPSVNPNSILVRMMRLKDNASRQPETPKSNVLWSHFITVNGPAMVVAVAVDQLQRGLKSGMK